MGDLPIVINPPYLSGASGDHDTLENRDIDDQHPISAITGLETALNDKVDAGEVGAAGGVAPLDELGFIPQEHIPTQDHRLLSNLADADQHTIASTTGLQDALDAKADLDVDGNIIRESTTSMLGTDAAPFASVHASILDLGNITAFPSGHKPGTMSFDPITGDTSLASKYDGVSNQLGKELWTDVQNWHTGQINNGQVCRIISAASANTRITLAQADLAINCEGLIGVATHDIAYHELGEITTFGLVRGLNTNAFEEGDTLYLSSTTAGALTNVRPAEPAKAVRIGIVVYKHSNNGTIFVTINMPACAAAAYTGLKDPTKWSLTYSAATRVAAVTVSAATDVTVLGQCITVPAATYTLDPHADTSGIYYIYVNGSGVPEIGTSFTFGEQAIAFYINYNGTTNAGVPADELHPDTWPASLHKYIHQTRGAERISGGAVSGATLGSSTTADMQFDIESLVFDDESRRHTLDALTGANGAYTYWYRSGADSASEWSWTTDANLPFPVSGTTAQYNLLSGGNWTLANMNTAQRWMVVWTVGTNAYPSATSKHRFINIVGQTLYTSLADAQNASILDSVAWGTFPFPEICPIAKTIIRYTNTSGNDFDYVSITSIIGTHISLTSITSPTSHGGLSGRSDPGSHPAIAISLGTTNFGYNLSTAEDTDQKAFDKLDDLTLDTIKAPTDVTTNNATASAHGLLPKLSGVSSDILRGDGTFGKQFWTDVASVTRTDSNTLAKAGLESVLPVGTHVRSYSGTTRPVTTSTDWKHHYVISVGTDAVDVIGEEIPTGGATLFVEYSTDIASTMAMPTRKLSGYWAATTGTSLIVNPVFSGNTLEWGEPAARLIGALQIRSGTDDTGANQPTIQITSGGTDLLGGALTVSETEANTGVIASGQALSTNEIIDVDCEATGSNADSYNLRMRFLIARHV